MTRWIGLVGVGLLAAVVVLVVIRPGAPATDAQRAEALAATLRCPDCQGLSVADSHTAAAREIRRQIDGLVAGGATDDEVRAHFVARYGEWVRLEPSSPLPWILPGAVVLAGIFLLTGWLARRRPSPTAPRLTEDERLRLHEEAEALDA